MESSKRTAVIPEWDIELADALGTIDVDRDAYGDCAATYVPSPNLVEAWFKCNPAIYTILRDIDTNVVVGYMNVMPIADSLFDGIMKGDFDEREIGPATLRRYDHPGFYRIYLCSAAILHRYRSGLAFRQLVNGFLNRLLSLAESKMYILDAVVDAVTPAGVQICNALGMNVVAKSTRGTDIYYVRMYPPDYRAVTRVAAKLRNVYRKAQFQVSTTHAREPVT